jgi:hypothetical protein
LGLALKKTLPLKEKEPCFGEKRDAEFAALKNSLKVSTSSQCHFELHRLHQPYFLLTLRSESMH